MKRVKFLVLFLLSYNLVYSVQITRTLNKTSIADKESILVTLVIKKTGVDGIAKLIEDIPAGFRAVVINKGGGRVLADKNGDLKIVWLTMPSSNSFKVEYRLLHLGNTKGDFYITGTFTYVFNNLKQDQIVESTALTVGNSKPVLTNSAFPENSNKQGDESKNSVPESNKTILYFTVQLGAYSSEKEDEVFKGLPEISYLLTNGLYKYYSGKFKTETEAKKNLEKAKSLGFTGAFITKN